MPTASKARLLAAGAALLSGVLSWRPSSAADALVLSTDFATGYYSRLDLAPPWAHDNNIQSTCSDAVVHAHGGRVYILGRFGCDFVQVVDGTTFATVRQWSTGNGTNPQDIEIVSPTKSYVSLYDRDYLLIANPDNGQELGRVDLSTFSDADGLPETAEMALVGDRLFVCLQRLDRPGGFVAANPSFVAVVDVGTNQLVDVDAGTPGVQAIPLTGRNPFSELALDPVRQKLYVAEAGNFGDLDGGVEYIDPATLDAEGFFIRESDLGGDLNAVRLWVDCNGYAVVNDASFRTKLVRFDRCSGDVLGPCWQSTGFYLCDLEIDFRRAQVLLSDRDLQQPGVRIFRAGSCAQLTTSPIDFGLPPCDLVLVDPLVPTDAPPPAAQALQLFPNWPDPFNPTTTLRIEAPSGMDTHLEVVDVRGRSVRVLWDGVVPAGGRDVVWDGRDTAGVVLPSGVYFARLAAASQTRVERLTLVR
jgi:hypothetical protein